MIQNIIAILIVILIIVYGVWSFRRANKKGCSCCSSNEDLIKKKHIKK